jgi:hypothetical protein
MPEMDELTAFASVPGLQGCVLHRGAKVLANQFPAIYAEASLREMTTAVTQLFSSYARVGRHPTEALWEFAEGSLLVLASHPATSGNNPKLLGADEELSIPFLTFLLDTSATATALIGPGRALLMRQAQVESAVWDSFHQELVKLLGKVLNRAQCEKLISRVLQQEAPDASQGLPRGRFLAFGQAVIKEIPNRAKHAPLIAELEKIISTLQNS